MTDNVSFKVALKDQENGGEKELRRFVVDKDVSTSFSYLQEKMCLVFPQLKQKIFSVSWADEDGDVVTIATDEELIIALTEMSGPVYKLAANVKSQKKSDNTKNDSFQESQIHPGVACDACNKKPIEGNRYKCVVCDDFDLCGSCEAAGRHPGHNMMRISNPEMAIPQRLFKRIHKIQERAEKHRSRQEKENGESSTGNSGAAPPPPFARGGHGMSHGDGMHGFGGMGHMGGMRGGFGGMGSGMHGMGGMRGGCRAGAWAGPAFEAMMKGWMQQPMGNQENKPKTNETTSHSSEHQQSHNAASEAAQEAHKQAHNAANGAQEAQNTAFEQFATMTGPAEYLKNVGSFVAAALDPFGIDVQVDIETPEGVRNTVQSPSTSSTVSNAEEEKTPNQEKDENMEEKKSKSPALDDEEWTVVANKKEETKTVEIPVKIVDNTVKDNLYPSLPENSTATAPPTAGPGPVPNHPDSKIQVALQAMMNMGFSNKGGWLTSLLEAKNGDIGKVLDILQPMRK